MIEKIRQWLYEPCVQGIDVDDNSLLAVHREVLLKKPLLRSAFETFYFDMATLCDKYFKVEGAEVELGSGAGFFKESRPSLVTSDIRMGPYIDIELNAQNMNLDDKSVRCVYAINVFHHLPDPERFFVELIRVLRSGGGCILIEPHCGFSSALLHRNLHKDEYFDPSAKSWRTTDIGGPLSGANQALAHIVFHRDIEIFKSQYGKELEVIYLGYELNALRYLFSGGLNFRQLVPSVLNRLLISMEFLARPFARFWSLHQVIVIRKR